MHLIHLSSSCVPSVLLFYKVNSSRESIWFFFLVRSLQDRKAIEIHLSIVLEEVFSLTTLNKPHVWKMKWKENKNPSAFYPSHLMELSSPRQHLRVFKSTPDAVITAAAWPGAAGEAVQGSLKKKKRWISPCSRCQKWGMAEEGEQLLPWSCDSHQCHTLGCPLPCSSGEVKMLLAIEKRQERESRGFCGKAQQSAPLITGTISHSWLLLAWGFAPHHHCCCPVG